jgi:hypothetical protein
MMPKTQGIRLAVNKIILNFQDNLTMEGEIIMKKTVFIALLAAVITSFLITNGSAGQTEERSQGQCSHHGGLSKDAGVCNDGSEVKDSSTKPVTNPYPQADPEVKPKESADMKAKGKACDKAIAAFSSANRKVDAFIDTGCCGSYCRGKVDKKYSAALAACKTTSCTAGKQKSIDAGYAKCDAGDKKLAVLRQLSDDAYKANKDICCQYDAGWCSK